MKPKATTNERRLAKLLRAGYHDAFSYGNAAETLAAFLAKRGVMKLTRNEREWVEQDRRLRRGAR